MPLLHTNWHQKDRKTLMNSFKCNDGIKTHSRGRSTYYSDRLHDFFVTIPKCYKDAYVNSFFPRTARLCNQGSQPTQQIKFPDISLISLTNSAEIP